MYIKIGINAQVKKLEHESSHFQTNTNRFAVGMEWVKSVDPYASLQV